MSLRVLLADESASIRKVFQMGLQDFGAEVKSVHNGLDVIEVATHFQPHIVFVDILLQKKNGYEVSQEMGAHAQLKNTPVVLMWSSFMELDQKKYQECGAGAELEKPFDVETMRQLIEKLAPVEDKARISEFLDFPTKITEEFVEEEKAKTGEFKVTTDVQETAEGFESQDPAAPQLEVELAPVADEHEEEHEANSVFNAQAGDFSMYEVSPPPTPQANTQTATVQDDPENWQSKPLQDQTFATPPPLPNDSDDKDEFQSMELSSEKKMDLNDFLYKPENNLTPPPPEENTSEIAPEIANVQMSPADLTQVSQLHQQVVISADETEAIIRAQVREILYPLVRDRLPTILEEIVKKELDEILKQEMAVRGTPLT